MDGAPNVSVRFKAAKFGFEADQCGDGVGRTGAQAALDGEALFDMDADFGVESEGFEGQRDHLPGGVAVVGGNAACRLR